MTIRAVLFVAMSIGWWRLPAASGGHAPPRDVTRAAGVAGAVGLVLAAMSRWLLSMLDVDDVTFEIATGLVGAAVGFARVLGWGAGEEALEGERSWAWPLAYPILIGPLTVLGAVAIGAVHGVVVVVAGLALGGVLSVLMGQALLSRALAVTLVRIGGVVTIVLAVALIFDGLRSV